MYQQKKNKKFTLGRKKTLKIIYVYSIDTLEKQVYNINNHKRRTTNETHNRQHKNNNRISSSDIHNGTYIHIWSVAIY